MAIGDPHFSKVVLACSFDTALKDESQYENAISPAGNAAISTTQKKYGASSAYLDGTGDYLTIPHNGWFEFGTLDFTIEGWVYLTSIANGPMFYAKCDALSHSSLGWWAQIGSNGEVYFGYGNTNAAYYVVSSGAAITTNTWIHLALVRSGANVKIFKNGTQVGSKDLADAAAHDKTNAAQFGRFFTSTTNDLNGYIDDIRITRGLARYAANFTPPASENPLYHAQIQGTVKAADGNFAQRIVRGHRRMDGFCFHETLSNPSNGEFTLNTLDTSKHYAVVHDNDAWITYLPFNGGDGYSMNNVDPWWGSVIFAMRMNGADNGTTFYEEKGNSVVAYNNAATKTGIKKFGTASAYFDGTDDYLLGQCAGDGGTAFAGDFTVECWVYLTSTTGEKSIFEGHTTGGGGVSLRVNNGAFKVSKPYSHDLFSAGTIPVNTWTHLAFVRDATSARGYVNGSLVATVTTTTFGSLAPYAIGGVAAVGYITGYVDDLRVTKGIARYTTSFSVATSEMPISGALQVFSEWSGKLATPYGHVHISTAQSKFGGASAYFDGSGDYLSFPESPDFTFDKMDFTVEFWTYKVGNGGRVVMFGVNSTNYGMQVYIDTDGSLLCREPTVAGSVATVSAAAGSIPNNVWTHIAVVCVNQTTLMLFINGIKVNESTSYSFNVAPSPRAMHIGCDPSATVTGYYNGYIDDLKISKGKAQYLSNFTPPTQSHFTPQEGDPYWNNVVLGCHFDGFPENGDTYRNNVVLNMRMNALTDDTGKAVTVVGNTTVSTSTKKYGSGSAYFDGNGDYLTLADSADWEFGSGDFTIEAWINATLTGWHAVVSQRNTAASQSAFIFYTDQTTGLLTFALSTSGTAFTHTLTSGTTYVQANVWTHVAAARNGNTLRLFIDGVLVGTMSVTGATIYNSTVPLMVGGDTYSSPSSFMNGYIDDLRITKGIARYTTDFTPPTTELPAITGAKWRDSATGKTITPYGNAVISATQSKFGGCSAYFDGSGDYLIIPFSADFNFGSADFAIEAWVYQNTQADWRTIVSKNPTDTSGVWRLIIGASGYLSFGYLNASTWTSVNAAGAVPISTWTHVAVTRQGSSLRLFVNGSLSSINASATLSIPDLSNNLYVGEVETTNTWQFNGYIEDLRITKGIARYTTNFTPPNAAFYEVLQTYGQQNAMIYDHLTPV
jgi:hypothetical protein